VAVKIVAWGFVLALLLGCQPADPSTNSSSSARSLSGLRVSTILGGALDSGFAVADHPRVFSFPADHGPHNSFRSEWWYLTAVLQDDDGNDYGVQFTLFRQALSPQPTGSGPWHTAMVYLAHLALTDVSAQTHQQAQRLSRGHPELAGVAVQPEFRAWIEDWSLQQADEETFALQLRANSPGEFGVALDMQPRLPVILQGQQGLSQKGPDSGSYYYSMPRLQVSGQLRQAGRWVDVRGLAWLDREWSTSVLPEQVIGWNWFALQLDDGRSIMAYSLLRKDGGRDPFDHGMLIEAPMVGDQSMGLTMEEGGALTAEDTGVSFLSADDFVLHPRRYWTDERGIAWPVAWTLDVADEQFLIEAPVYDQVMDKALIYWEGFVEIYNTSKLRNGERDESSGRIGRGYMELTGYQILQADGKND